MLYNIGIQALHIGIHIAALFNPKAKRWVAGRRQWKQRLKTQVENQHLKGAIWFHCASLGEFEQGRPVIEKIKMEHPTQKIVLTFFSPSGFDIQKNYALADMVMYLPIDSVSNARNFLTILKPKLAIFVKYEFWLNYLFELHRQHIPTFLISTVIKPHQSFFKWYGKRFRKALHTYQAIFTQDHHSLNLLQKLNITSGKLAGDTRFDRVLEICASPKTFHEIEQFAHQSFLMVAGSSWQKDEEYVVEAYVTLKPKYPALKLIIAPHEIDKHHIDRLKNLLNTHGITYHLFSDNLSHYQHPVLIINTIGLLSSIYQYGHIAFIGGGFNNGIHNVLEPSVYGLPVLFGPNYTKFNEAFDLMAVKAGFTVSDAKDIYRQLQHLMTHPDELNRASLAAKNYVLTHAGATKTIYATLKSYINIPFYSLS